MSETRTRSVELRRDVEGSEWGGRLELTPGRDLVHAIKNSHTQSARCESPGIERNASTGALSCFIADQSTYTLTAADAGSVITVVASYTDGGGNFEQVHSAGTQPVNTPPVFTSPSSVSVPENQPIGAIVGEFNATDPDVNATLTYHLVSGAGDGNNSLFTLESNGTLKTATTFDYETNASTYSIRVQAKDEFNATAEGNFTVTLTNVNEPATGAVSLTGTPVVGQTLTASNTLADPTASGRSLTNGTGTDNRSCMAEPSRMVWMGWTA